MITDDPHPSDPATAPAITTASSPAAAAAIGIARALPADLAAAHAMIRQLLEARQEDAKLIGGLQHQLDQLLRRLYGRSAEKIDPNQLTLFADLLAKLQPPPASPSPVPSPATTTAPAQPATDRPATSGHGRRKFPADLPRDRREIDLPEDQKPCPCCGQMRCRMGEDVSEKLDFVPAHLVVRQTVRFKYVCKQCEQEAKNPQIVISELPLSPIEKGLAAPGLLAYVIVSKFSDHCPLHRLERILARHGIEISRSTMGDWMAACARALEPLYDRMVQEVLGSRVLHTDDTPVDVLDPSLQQTRTGRLWIYSGDRAHPGDVFAFTPSRSRDGPMEFLKGWGRDRRVYLQADAFGGYDGIYRGEAGGDVVEVACWAHARRKFYEARHSDAAGSAQALAHIGLLYEVERQAQEKFQTQEQAADAQSESSPMRTLSAIRHQLRQAHSVARLEQFKAWLISQQAAAGGPVLPKSPMGQAITYALNQWDALCVYCTDGDLDIDNNVSERTIRRIATGRNNWTFLGSDNGGKTAAILYSFIATCERHEVNPFDYLRDVLDRIAACPVSRLADLLPHRWKSPASVPANTPA